MPLLLGRKIDTAEEETPVILTGACAAFSPVSRWARKRGVQGFEPPFPPPVHGTAHWPCVFHPAVRFLLLKALRKLVL